MSAAAASGRRGVRFGALGVAFAVMVGAFGLALVVVSAGPAHAAPAKCQPTMVTTCPSTTPTKCQPTMVTTCPSTSGNPTAGCTQMVPTSVCPNGAATGQTGNTDDGKSGKITDTVLGGIKTGGKDTASLGSYHIYYDAGSFGVKKTLGFIPTGIETPSPIGMLEGWLTDTVFTLARYVNQFALQILSWVYDSGLRDWINNNLVPGAAQVSRNLNRQILGPLNLAGFLLFLTLVYAGWKTFRGQASAGLGEFGLSLVIYAAAMITMADPVTGFVQAVNGVTDISSEVMNASLSNGITTGSDAGNAGRCPSANGSSGKPDFNVVKCVLRVELVDVPYDMLNFGQVIAPNNHCWSARQKILAQGLDARSVKDVDSALKAAGGDCEKMLAKNPSMDRFFAAVIFMLSTLVMLGVLIIFALMVLMSLLTAIFLMMFAWPMFAVGLLPGAGRRVFWRYGTSIVAALAAVIAMGAFLAVLVWGCAETLSVTGGIPIAVRFLLMDLVGIMLLRLRKTMLHKITTAVRGTGDRLQNRPAGGYAMAAAGGAAAGALAGGAMAGAPIRWGGSAARPHPDKGPNAMSAWVHPAQYRSPRMAAPNELSHQIEQKFWHSKAGRPVVRAKRGISYPIRHPVKTAMAPVKAVTYPVRHPIRTVTAPVRLPAKAIGATGKAAANPVQSAKKFGNATKKPFQPLPKATKKHDYDGHGYPNNHHPWIPE